LAPIFGGYIADRWIGARYLIPLGLFIMAIGYWIGSNATGLGAVSAMVCLVSIGTAFFKGNISAVNGQLFDDPKRLDPAFSIQYTFVNIGSFFGTTILGYALENTFAHDGVLGFSQTFLCAAILCAIGGVWFIIAWRFLGNIGKRPFKEGIVEEKQEKVTEPLTKIEWKRIWAIILVSLFSVIFWLFWYLTYLAVYDYGGKYVNWNVGGFTVPIGWFDSLNALCCIVLGPVLAAIWGKLAKRPQGDLSMFKKTALGLALLGVAFFMLVFGELTRGVGSPDTVKASLIWIVLFGVALSLGEMCFSPLGNSFVSKFAPKKILAVLMGVWTFATFIAGLTYGHVYAWLNSKFSFMTIYIAIPIILFICGAILFAADKKLSKLVVEDDENK
ncbi:MAG: peptide MFS transporter, partial [Clostridioides sp.]|nr:peptide MFS transporter [Clostridioides sp.]